MTIDRKPWLVTLKKTSFEQGDYVRINDGTDSFTVGRVWGADRCGDYITAKKRTYRLWVLISEAQRMTSYVRIEKCEKITREEWFKQRLIEGVE